MIRYERDSLALKNYVKFLRDNKKTFVVKHGTYTTTVETQHGKNKYETHQFSDRVFIAAAMIRKDVVNSEMGQRIMELPHEKINFGHHQKLEPFKADEVLNIDISGAYATCLYVNGLITDKTFKYLKKLRKEERLPSVGMLARSACLWKYDGGECVDIVVERSKTAQVFYYLIEEINYVMRSIQWELGKHFYFYWVDGVFFSKDTPKRLITNVENLLISKNYLYKYEEVKNFKLTKNKHGVYTIDMVKNGEIKKYQFQDTNNGKEVANYLMQISNGEERKN